MTTIELQQWRESFVERYLNKIDDMEISEELERAAKKIFSKRRTPRPCVIHSQEEMIAEVRKSVEDAREGRVTSSEDLDLSNIRVLRHRNTEDIKLPPAVFRVVM